MANLGSILSGMEHIGDNLSPDHLGNLYHLDQPMSLVGLTRK